MAVLELKLRSLAASRSQPDRRVSQSGRSRRMQLSRPLLPWGQELAPSGRVVDLSFGDPPPPVGSASRRSSDAVTGKGLKQLGAGEHRQPAPEREKDPVGDPGLTALSLDRDERDANDCPE